jgi:uracil-DNA glycosylase family 4
VTRPSRGLLARDPDANCSLCPRLAAFRAEIEAAEPNWFNAPVPGFGDGAASLLVVGLAPGLKGANRTGRPFTGDFAGDLLYETLTDFGFADGRYLGHVHDGLRLKRCFVTNAVRCVPPANKPIPVEIATCRPFLAASIESLPELRAVIALGRIAHDSVVRASQAKLGGFPFAHAAEHELPGGGTGKVMLFDSYHCSRYNTNTRVLTRDMFRAVFSRVRQWLDNGHTSAREPHGLMGPEPPGQKSNRSDDP